MVRLNQDPQDERLGCDAQSPGAPFWACCLLFPLILLSPSGCGWMRPLGGPPSRPGGERAEAQRIYCLGHFPVRSTSSRSHIPRGSLRTTLSPLRQHPAPNPAFLHNPSKFPYCCLYLCNQLVADKASVGIRT